MPLRYPASLQIAGPLNTGLPGGGPICSEMVADFVRDGGRFAPKYAA